MTEESEQKDESKQDPSAPVDEIRAKFLAALAKKQSGQKGGPGAQKDGKSGGPNSSDGHSQRHFQRKSGAS